VTGASYDRYGLTGNPFRELAAENLSDVELFHVNLEVDDALRTIEEEVFDKENRAVVALVGEHGSGKTERLLLAAAEARQRNAFTVYYDVTAKTPWILRGLAQEIRKTADARKVARTFSSPAWLRGIAALEKAKDEKYDAVAAGKAIGLALNETAPSLLLMNDLHNLIESREVHAFAKTIQEVTDVMKPGVLLMFVCYPSYLAWLTVNHAPLASRINRSFRLPGLTNDEAALLLAKKMLPKRLVEDLDPIYPFDRAAVAALNEASGGNPRRLLEVADRAIEFGVTHRLYRVDASVVRTVQPQRPAAATGAVPPGPSLSAPSYSEETKGGSVVAAGTPGPGVRGT
jgi:type II secretory pathway predicted ATPase ExeA